MKVCAGRKTAYLNGLSYEECKTLAEDITQKLNIGLIYKTSYDKANRTSLKGKRGAGLETSLPFFDKI